jgi:serine/threonine protein kinase
MSNTSDVRSSDGELASIASGEVIDGRYLVGPQIGAGGMGVVCEATHLGLGTAVAIKLIRGDFKQDQECVQRFLNEARRAARLKSERIARVHDVGQLDSGEPYLVMELLEGSELQKYLEDHGPLSQADAINVVLQICEGLADAHANGVVHRDIKPANVFLARRSDGRLSVKLLDFGISKQFHDSPPDELTGRNESLGSPWYMSPEQMIDASRVDQRSDIWSVGVVLYELLTGQHAFDGANVPEICARVLTASAPSLRLLRADLDPALDAIVQRCLEKRPDDRYPDIIALGMALAPFARAADSRRSRVIGTEFFSSDLEGRRSSYPERASSSDPFLSSLERLDSTAPTAAPTPAQARRLRRAHWLGGFGVAAVVAFLGLALVRSSENPSLLAGSPIKAAAGKVRLGPGLPAVRLWRPLLNADAPLVPLDRGNEPVPLAVAITAPVHDSGAEDTGDEITSEPAAAPRTLSEPSAPRPMTGGISPSPDEIRARLERYQRWVREQGLTPIGEGVSRPRFMDEN